MDSRATRNIARQLRVRRAALGWSQTQLAKKAGVSINSVAFWESHRHVPDFESLYKLSKILSRKGQSFEEFMYEIKSNSVTVEWKDIQEVK